LGKYYLSAGYFDEAFVQLTYVFRDPLVESQTKIQLLYSYFPPENSKLNQKTYQLINYLIESHSDDALVYATYAEYLLKDGKYKLAKDQLLKVLSYNKQSFQIWDQLLNVDLLLRDFTSLVSDCQEAITYFPNQPLLYLYNGLGYSNLNEYHKAIERFTSGLDLIVDNELLESEFYSQLAEAYNSIEDYKKSDFYFDSYLQINPLNLSILNNYSYYLSVRGENLEKAKEMIKKVIQVEPLNPTYLDTYAWVLFKCKEYTDALKYIEMAIKYSSTPDAIVIEHYGDILFRNNNPESALQQWKLADSIGKGSDFLKDKINRKTIIE
jgi:tetratricopeptide (TPR) repeat protein